MSERNICQAADQDGPGIAGVKTFDGSRWQSSGVSFSNDIVLLSCASASFCTAVDGTLMASTSDGSAWPAAVKIEPGTDTGIRAVPCAAPDGCVVADDEGQAVVGTY